jgi:hypothetical protein
MLIIYYEVSLINHIGDYDLPPRILRSSAYLEFDPIHARRYQLCKDSGQVDCVTNLMTAEDTSTTITDTTFTYSNPINFGLATTDLKYGLSLISYESWMTDTFSFNITMLPTISSTGATIRFTVLDNTFFTMAKVHYLVIWRSSGDVGPTGASVRYNMEVIYGCNFSVIQVI